MQRTATVEGRQSSRQAVEASMAALSTALFGHRANARDAKMRLVQPVCHSLPRPTNIAVDLPHASPSTTHSGLNHPHYASRPRSPSPDSSVLTYRHNGWRR